MRDTVEGKISEEQETFQKKGNYICMAQLFTARMLIEKVTVRTKEYVIMRACVNLEIAYDNVNRKIIWNVLEDFGVKEAWQRQ